MHWRFAGDTESGPSYPEAVALKLGSPANSGNDPQGRRAGRCDQPIHGQVVVEDQEKDQHPAVIAVEVRSHRTAIASEDEELWPSARGKPRVEKVASEQSGEERRDKGGSEATLP